ncbi:MULTISPECIES: hypothetical protein [unclassified Vibrio]|nr:MULTISPECIES: hypothetical protein [unclassified Vibrio]
MLIQISNGFAEHVSNYMTAIPFASVLVIFIGIGYISHYRQTH